MFQTLGPHNSALPLISVHGRVCLHAGFSNFPGMVNWLVSRLFFTVLSFVLSDERQTLKTVKKSLEFSIPGKFENPACKQTRPCTEINGNAELCGPNDFWVILHMSRHEPLQFDHFLQSGPTLMYVLLQYKLA